MFRFTPRLTTVVYLNMLGARVILQSVDREIPSIARALEAAPRHFISQHQVGIDPHGSRVNLAEHVDGSRCIRGPYGSAQTIRSFIGTPDGFVFRFEGFHRNDRAKDFFPCGFGAWQNVGQHGRLDKEALAVGGLATEYGHRPFLLCALQESLDSLEMLLGYQRTLLDVVAFDWVAHAQRLNLRHQLFHQLSFYFLVHQDAGTSAALLARVPEPCLANAFCNRVKIGILKDNNWCFATKFQVHSLQRITRS